ncbi:type IV pilus modification protein PilV, partial [Mycobacterium tuberculosis]
MTARHLGARRARQGGFTMIEVLIAIVVMSIGLLGFALLQTMNVRFVQSANFRTQATNLSYELLDQIRINRLNAGTYVGTYT